MKIVEYLNQNGRITNRDLRSMFKVSDEVARKGINKLVYLGIVKSEGKGRGLYYVLAQLAITEQKGEGKAIYYVAKAG